MGSKYRDLTRQMARWCDIPAPSSPFPHMRTRDYHRWDSQGVPWTIFLIHWIAGFTSSSWSDRASPPRKRARSAHCETTKM